MATVADVLLIFVNVLFLMMAGHFVADYPLQTDFLAKGKSPKAENQFVPWQYIMASHAFTHALAVYIVAAVYLGRFSLVTVVLAVLELVGHFIADVMKCCGMTDIHGDQEFHLICKLLWTSCVLVVLASPATWVATSVCVLAAVVVAVMLLIAATKYKLLKKSPG